MNAMFTLHEAGIGKRQRILGYVLSLLPSLAVFGSGVAKFFPGHEIHALLAELGLGGQAVVIGLTEIGCVVLYWIPRTTNVGFFLFCSYIGAILVGELVLGQVPLPALAIGSMVYAGTYLRRPGWFWG